MGRYIAGRVLQSMVALFVLLTGVFFILRVVGDPVQFLLPVQATQEDIERVRQNLGLDRPIYIQYFIYLRDLLHFDFGESIYARGESALSVVMSRIPATLSLAATSMGLVALTAVPAGVYAAIRANKPEDWIIRFFAILGNSFPIFWLGILLILIFSVFLNWLPAFGNDGPLNYILPSVTLAWFISAGVTRITRSSMLEVMRGDYIRTARAKGLGPRQVIWTHAFRNAALSVVTYVSLVAFTLIGGTIVTETVFAWPGVGRLVIQSIGWRDLPVIQTIVLFIGSVFLLGNMVVDVLYTFIDPRLRYRP